MRLLRPAHVKFQLKKIKPHLSQASSCTLSKSKGHKQHGASLGPRNGRLQRYSDLVNGDVSLLLLAAPQIPATSQRGYQTPVAAPRDMGQKGRSKEDGDN